MTFGTTKTGSMYHALSYGQLRCDKALTDSPIGKEVAEDCAEIAVVEYMGEPIAEKIRERFNISLDNITK